MNVGIDELLVVMLNLMLVLAVPAIFILAIILLFRRNLRLEARVTELGRKEDPKPS